MVRTNLVCSFLLFSSGLPSQECPQGSLNKVTDDFYFLASSDQGAPGDVVAVDLLLQVDAFTPNYRLQGLSFTCCFDGLLAELLQPPEYTKAFDDLFFASDFYTVPRREDPPKGFSAHGALRPPGVAAYLPTKEPLHLATVYFRLKGPPNSSFPVQFCNTLANPGICAHTSLLYAREDGADESLPRFMSAFSTRHVPGEIRIIEGEPTRPDPPALPPTAKVYAEAPTGETAGIVLELGGAVASPGARDVPVPLYVTSNFEFSGFEVSLSFPQAGLELARVEEHTRPGALTIDNDAGHMVLYMDNSTRRVGAEGERVRLATLFFNLKEGAETLGDLESRFESFGSYFNWLSIRYKDQINLGELPVTAKVEPFLVAAGLLKIQKQPTILGDVDLSYDLTITDPIALLRHLFRGEEVLCIAAGDFNQDFRVDISDAVAILGHLFLGLQGPPASSVDCTAR